MALLNSIPVFDHAFFHKNWNDGKTKLVLSQEMSSLEYTARRIAKEGLPFKQIYDDACDVGLSIKGTQSTMTFAFVEDECGPNHWRCEDIHGWRGELIPEQQRKLSVKVEVLIIND